jgi:type I restriction enzyme S subunit
VLNKRDFLKIRIPLPDIEEQQRIACFLGEVDREIDPLRKQLDAFKQQKKGLMQKLLTGEIRVKLPQEDRWPPLTQG